MKAKRKKQIWTVLTALSYGLLILPVFGDWFDIPRYLMVVLLISFGMSLWILTEGYKRWKSNRGKAFPPRSLVRRFMIINPFVLGIFLEIVSQYYPAPPF